MNKLPRLANYKQEYVRDFTVLYAQACNTHDRSAFVFERLDVVNWAELLIHCTVQLEEEAALELQQRLQLRPLEHRSILDLSKVHKHITGKPLKDVFKTMIENLLATTPENLNEERRLQQALFRNVLCRQTRGLEALLPRLQEGASNTQLKLSGWLARKTGPTFLSNIDPVRCSLFSTGRKSYENFLNLERPPSRTARTIRSTKNGGIFCTDWRGYRSNRASYHRQVVCVSSWLSKSTPGVDLSIVTGSTASQADSTRRKHCNSVCLQRW